MRELNNMEREKIYLVNEEPNVIEIIIITLVFLILFIMVLVAAKKKDDDDEKRSTEEVSEEVRTLRESNDSLNTFIKIIIFFTFLISPPTGIVLLIIFCMCY